MPRVPPFDRPATYDDLVKVADPLVAELVNGELHTSPRPALRHARTGAVLGYQIGVPFDGGRRGSEGWWMLYEAELHLGPDVLVPDWAGWRRSRLPAIPDTPACSIAPDWVCEILSPSTVALDRTRKLGIYAREGVANAWLVDPLSRTLEVLRLEHGRWTILATHVGDEVVRAEPFAEVALDMSALWTDPP